MNANIFKPSRERLVVPAAAFLGAIALTGCSETASEVYTVPEDTSLSEIVQENCPEADWQENIYGQFAIIDASERANNHISTGDVLNIPANLCDDIRIEER